MFNKPIKHTRLNTLEEVIKVSFQTGERTTPKVKCQNNGQIAFTNDYGIVYVTPYRTEIHSILEEAGYKEGSIFVPFSNGEERPDSYKWLAKIAEEENWAHTYEKAFEVAMEKGITPFVKLSGKYQIKEISYYNDTDTHTVYSALTTMYLMNNSKENVGTYILVDEKTIVICDEYGRTFLLKAKTVVNDIVNSLIDAGYTRTYHPEWYINQYDPPVESEE